MTTDTLTVILQMINRMTGPLSQVEKQLAQVDRRIRLTQKLAGMGLNFKGGKIVDSLGNVVGQQELVTRRFKQMEAAAKKASGSMRQQFDMNALSLLFFGMALQRFFGGILRSLFNTFQKAEGNTSELSKATLRLQAAWEFLKFAIFNALDQPEIINFIDNLIITIDRLSEWVQQNEDLIITFLKLIGLAAIFGGIIMTYGILKLGITSLIKVFSELKVALFAVMTPAKFIILLIILLAVAYALTRKQIDKTDSVLNSFKLTLSGLADILVGIFEGDMNKIGRGFVKFGVGLVAAIYNTFIWLIRFTLEGFEGLGALFVIGAKHLGLGFWDSLKHYLLGTEMTHTWRNFMDEWVGHLETVTKEGDEFWDSKLWKDPGDDANKLIKKMGLIEEEFSNIQEKAYDLKKGTKLTGVSAGDIISQNLGKPIKKVGLDTETNDTFNELNGLLEDTDFNIKDVENSFNSYTNAIESNVKPAFQGMMDSIGLSEGDNLLGSLDFLNTKMEIGSNEVIPNAIDASKNLVGQRDTEIQKTNALAAAEERLNRARGGSGYNKSDPNIIVTATGKVIDLNVGIIGQSSTYGVN